MTVNLGEISRRLGIPSEELMKKGILSFVAQEIRLAEWDIADIKERYGASSPRDLQSKIEGREIASHPAWEDLIHWENLENYISRLRAIEEDVKTAA
ncbi:MAG: hypothetical protein EPO21_08615 [Chloroflexota bacterium]|nr:MAG: hypothetical protein EPO21_08615 [Chloroflexota bacterium]